MSLTESLRADESLRLGNLIIPQPFRTESRSGESRPWEFIAEWVASTRALFNDSMDLSTVSVSVYRGTTRHLQMIISMLPETKFR